MAIAAPSVDTPDFAAIKAKQNVTWSSGDYAKIGTTLQIVGERLAEALELHPRSSVLDVAAGNGNATLAFARRWNAVTSTDYVPALLERGRTRAEAEGLSVQFQVADAEALPFDDARFDAVVSTFGVMFTPNQQQAAQELTRVCRSGGKIGLANWTPDGFIGQLFEALGQFVAPPPNVQPLTNWGSESWISSTFGDVATSAVIDSREFIFRYRSADHFLEVFRTYHGPVHKAFLSLDAPEQAALETDIKSVIAQFNDATDSSMRVPAEYLEIVIEKA
ncbi:MAG: methyltransferase domain-containing protein [Hyphomicrobiaceae bacterium]